MRKAAIYSIILASAISLLQQSVLPQGYDHPAHEENQKESLVDLDRDGIPDQTEQELAEQYAPLLLLDPDEPNLPMDVQSFLASAELWSYDESCKPARAFISPVQGHIEVRSFQSCGGFPVNSHGTRSSAKKHTFYLRAINAGVRRATSTSEWTTYFHAYRNDLHGITLQYWSFYGYNTGYFWGIEVPAASHEGDWEAIHVVLGPAPSSKPALIRLLGHKNIESHPWSDVITTSGHPIIRLEKGGHTSVLAHKSEAANLRAFIQHESWSGGRVRWAAKELQRWEDP